MLFDDCTEGEYRIFAGALEAPAGGYIAALVIRHLPPADGAAGAAERTVFRDDSVACGHRWASAEAAIAYALARGREFARRQVDEVTDSGRAAA